MRLADVPAVVDVHTSQLGGSLLDELGAGFLMLYYEHLASTPHGVTIVAEDTARDRIVGLCAGTATSDSVYLDMARAHLWRTLGLTTARLLTHPGAVLRAISAARSKQHSPTDSLQGTRRAGDATSGSTEFVLQTIAVAPEAEGKGLGSAMLQTFIELARASDADSVSLMTEEDGNDRVHKLYEAAGFRSTGKRVGSGSRKVIAYELELDGPE